MIVKNESKIIIRLLQSVYNILGNSMTYCICDTGSTDDTCELINIFAQGKGIKGQIIHEPFKNFEYNRNFALSEIQRLEIKCDYVLLLDADMILSGNMVNILNYIASKMNTIQVYHVFQGNDDFFYPNTRIIKNLPMNGIKNVLGNDKELIYDGFYYTGVTHEVIVIPKDFKVDVIDRGIVFINDVGDGGAKADKYIRDIRLLLEHLEIEPNNDRSTFYLANSYHDSEQYEKAIESYKKRISLGGWIEELFFSYYRIGLCYMALSKPNKFGNMGNPALVENAVYYFIKAYDVHPHRVENLYQLIKHFRSTNSGRVALLYCKMAREIAKASMAKGTPQFLFHHNGIYEYGLDVEYIVLSKLDGNTDVSKELINVLNRSNEVGMCNEALFYFNLYTSYVKGNAIKHFTFNSNIGVFVSSSASIININNNNGYIFNVRYVNYSIKPDGSYDCGDQIETINAQYTLGNKMNVVSRHIYDNGINDMRRYRGVEDVRIFRHGGNNNNNANANVNIYFTGTGLHKNGRIGIMFGRYTNDKQLSPIELASPYNQECEKNWIFVQNTLPEHKDKIRMVYRWHPLEIGEVNESAGVFNIIEKYPSPRSFRFVRGSTNLIKFDKNNLFAICHLVAPNIQNTPRTYFHMFVKISNDFKTIKYTMPFKFTSDPIEYCIGLVIGGGNEGSDGNKNGSKGNDEIICTYSTWDRTTNICVFNKSFVNSLFLDFA